MKTRNKLWKRFCGGLAAAGGLFLLAALALWKLGGERFGISFPRNDTAPLGFAVVGILYLLCATGVLCALKDKKAMIEENDERNQKIQAVAGLCAFGIQSLLLITGLFLMSFMGYLNVVSACYLCAAILLGIAVFMVLQAIFNKQM